MRKVLENPNLMEYFKERVEEAMSRQGITASAMLEFYLVNLLQEFRRIDKLSHYPLALMLAKALEGDVQTRIRMLKQIGDSALYLSGFFSESIRRKPVKVDYYVRMGGGAYGSLSQILASQKTFGKLYGELASRFSECVSVLSHVAAQNRELTNRDLLALYERWLATQDRHIEDLLQKAGIQISESSRYTNKIQ